jgi:chemotaxis signal transduction protein
LLPAAAQRLVELDERKQFVSFRLGQTQLSIEEFAIRVKRVEQRINATLISLPIWR